MCSVVKLKLRCSINEVAKACMEIFNFKKSYAFKMVRVSSW